MEDKKVMQENNSEEKNSTNEVEKCVSNNAEKSQDRIKKINQIKEKKFFKNFFIIIVAIVAIVCALLALDKYENVFDGKVINLITIKKDDSNVDDKEYSDEKKAVEVAKRKFSELGENTDNIELEVLKITRKGKVYYFISAKDNTVEISADTFEIKRINSVPVEEYEK